jgi:hypothetical protein
VACFGQTVIWPPQKVTAGLAVQRVTWIGQAVACVGHWVIAAEHWVSLTGQVVG